ncbi:MAG: DUF3572 domain-containing protein [Pseudomonadota bacterium]
MRDDGSTSHQLVAVAALSWIAADTTLINRFLDLTGLSPDNIRAAATNDAFLASVLDFILNHEPTLMSFCAENELDPKTVDQARRHLSPQNVPGPGDYV